MAIFTVLKIGPEPSKHTICEQWKINSNPNSSQSTSFMMDKKQVRVGENRVIVY